MNIKTLLKWGLPIALLLFICVAFAGITGGLTMLSSRAAEAGLNIPGLEFIRSANPISGSATGLIPGHGGNLPSQVFIPVIANPIAESPDIAVLQAVSGIVQVQQKDNSWKTVQTAEIKAGQTFRTWNYSSAVLYFYDGSSMSLEANTRIKLEELNAAKDGPREIVIFQPYGETQHTVAPSKGNGSYLVSTPSANGAAKGTIFQVVVEEDKSTQFATIEGTVAVTGKQATVEISAGEMTFVENDEEPAPPVFWITGQGEVSEIGEVWVIGGLTFQTHEGTVVIGDPQVGDLVSVRGQLLPDGTRLADKITLLVPSLEDQFRLTGVVEVMGALLDPWTISGREIQVDETTQIDEGIEVGSQVLVIGVIRDGVLFATQINLLEEATHFEFSGMVEQIDGDIWTIAGVAITTDANTEFTGDPGVGDLVRVEGRILADGTWLAREIKKVSELDQFEFIGIVESIAPWLVSGNSFEVDEFTFISPDIVVGSLVRVEGTILEDGTWLASSVELLDETNTVVFIGIVDSIDPWVVNGLSLTEDDNTVFIGEIVVGSLVRVEARILPDGSWLIVQMELIEVDPVVGCIEFVDVVASVTRTEIVLLNGPAIPAAIAEIEGDLVVGSQVFVKLCFGPENVMVFAWILVVGEPIRPTPPPPLPTRTPPPSEDGKVTICHVPPGNPDNAHTITVGEPAVQAHLAHGDYLGPCR